MTEINPEWKVNIEGCTWQVHDTKIDSCRVSTIFCRGLNLWPVEDFFETIIFGLEEDYERRCKTAEEAEKQHNEAVEYVKKIEQS